MTSFKKFVKMQPPDRVIVHGHGWSKCAVGDYLDECLKQSRTEPLGEVEINNIINNSKAYNILKMDGRHIVESCTDNKVVEYFIIDTYGKLGELL